MLKKVIEQMYDELDDTEKYIRYALKYKADNQNAFNTYIQLSESEMQHFNKLHDLAEELVKNKEKEPTSEEMIIYEYEHKKAVEKASEIKLMWEIARK